MEQNVIEILETAEAIKKFVESMEHYDVTDRAIEYYNCGYSRVYTLPDWDKFLEDVKKSYTWVNTVEDLEEAVTDALFNYMISSRG